jgi:hypothetical protein
LKYLIDYIYRNNLKDLDDLQMMKDFLFWKIPTLNYALRYIYLKYSKMQGLHKFCIYMLEKASNVAIIFYLPQLLQGIRTNTKNEVEKYILNKSKNSSTIAHQFLWSLEVEEISKIY